MVKDSMDLLELLRKRGVNGDVDFLREALRVLMDAIMDAEVSARIGAEHGERSPDRLNPNPPKGACERPPEEAKGCTFESEIMVLNQKTCHRKGAPNRCYHVTTLTASKSPSTIPAW